MIHLPPREHFKCPVCGKTVTLYCRRGEWGYWYEVSRGPTLLCSSECVKAFADRDLAKRVARVKRTAAYRQWIMRGQGMSDSQIAKAMKLRTVSNISTNILNLEAQYWQELAWIERHEGVTA